MKNIFTQNTGINKKSLQSFVGKDSSAFKYFYTETSTRVFSLILYIVKKRDLANQVLEQTYLQIWEETPNRSSARVTAIDYILILAKNNSTKALRKIPHL